MTWTHFWDMNSGGGRKEDWQHIFIEAPEAEAKVIFFNRFGHNPERVSCTCCGEDYAISEEPTLARATSYHRHCDNLKTPRLPDGRYDNDLRERDPWFAEHFYLEPEDVGEAKRRGYEVEENTSRRIGREHGSDYGRYLTVEEFVATSDVLVITADDIQDIEREGNVPEQGYVWVG